MAETNEIWDAVKRTKYQRTFDQLFDILSNANKDVDGAIASTLNVVCTISHSEAGTFWFYDKAKEGLIRARAVYGGADLSNIRLLPGEGIAGKVIQTQEPVIVSNVETNKDWARSVDKKTSFNTKSIICVPLVARGSSFGCIQLINKTDASYFDDSDLDLVVNLTHEISTLCERYNILVDEKEYETVCTLFVGMKDLLNGAFDVEPSDLFSALKKYYSIIEAPILKNGGTISKIGQDGVMAYWIYDKAVEEEKQKQKEENDDDDEPVFNQAILSACKAATDIIELREALQNEVANKYSIGFGISFGITYGKVYMGDVGTSNSSHYTLVGHSVNLVRGLEEIAPSGDIYVDEAAAAEVSEVVSFSKVKQKILKHSKTDVYKIEGYKD